MSHNTGFHCQVSYRVWDSPPKGVRGGEWRVNFATFPIFLLSYYDGFQCFSAVLFVINAIKKAIKGVFGADLGFKMRERIFTHAGT